MKSAINKLIVNSSDENKEKEPGWNVQLGNSNFILPYQIRIGVQGLSKRHPFDD